MNTYMFDIYIYRTNNICLKPTNRTDLAQIPYSKFRSGTRADEFGIIITCSNIGVECSH